MGRKSQPETSQQQQNNQKEQQTNTNDKNDNRQHHHQDTSNQINANKQPAATKVSQYGAGLRGRGKRGRAGTKRRNLGGGQHLTTVISAKAPSIVSSSSQKDITGHLSTTTATSITPALTNVGSIPSVATGTSLASEKASLTPTTISTSTGTSTNQQTTLSTTTLAQHNHKPKEESGHPASAAVSSASANSNTSQQERQEVATDYQLLLTQPFAAMTKITDNLFLTGVGGMTHENFRRNHIDFVVNITTEAPFWDDIESMRLPLDDDVKTNLLPYLDTAVDRIQDVITKKNAHVLVHCVAGVSRSATIVIAYLMKYKRMDLKTAFNHCYNLRPVIRPNNGFMIQLINYEFQLFNKHTVSMQEVDVDGIIISVPNFFVDEYPKLVLLEVMRARDQQKKTLKDQQPTTNNSNSTNTTNITTPHKSLVETQKNTPTSIGNPTTNTTNITPKTITNKDKKSSAHTTSND